MARTSNKTKLTSVIAKLSAADAGKLADFLESVVEASASEDVEGVAPKRRGRKPASETGTGTTRTRRSRRAASDETETAPTRTRRVRATRFSEDDLTLDDIHDFLENYEGDPVEGTLSELRTQLRDMNVDPKVIEENADDDSAAGRKLEMGVTLSALTEIMAKLKKHEVAEVQDVAEELGVKVGSQIGSMSKNIIAALFEDDEEGDEPEEDDFEEEEEEEAPAPKRRGRKPASAKASAPKRGRRAKVEEEDEDELDDLDDLDDLD